MGLDAVEFVLAVESAFEVRLEDAEVAKIRTPGDLIDLLASRLPTGGSEYRLRQRALEMLYEALAGRLHLRPSDLTPATSLVDLLPKDKVERKALQKAIQDSVGVRRWPHLGKPGWLGIFRKPCDELREIAAFLVAHCPTAFKRPNEGWTRDQIAETVRELVIDELPVTESDYSETSRFVEDWGIE